MDIPLHSLGQLKTLQIGCQFLDLGPSRHLGNNGDAKWGYQGEGNRDTRDGDKTGQENESSRVSHFNYCNNTHHRQPEIDMTVYLLERLNLKDAKHKKFA